MPTKASVKESLPLSQAETTGERRHFLISPRFRIIRVNKIEKNSRSFYIGLQLLDNERSGYGIGRKTVTGRRGLNEELVRGGSGKKL